MTRRKDQEPKGFRKALEKAKGMLQDGGKTRELIDKAIQKAGKHKHAVRDFWSDLKTLQRLISAYVSGDYRDVSLNTLLYALAGIIYFVNPFDVIPDFLAGLGFIDDAGIIAFVMKSIKGELDKFAEWESSRQSDEDHLGI